MTRWIKTPPPKTSFRSILKWGAPDAYKNPGRGFLRVIRTALELKKSDFKTMASTGEKTVEDSLPCAIDPGVKEKILAAVGSDNVSEATYDRLKYSSGKAMEDLMRLREGDIREICDLVVHPRDREDVAKVLSICHTHKVPLHVHGAGSSVTFALACPRGGVTLVMGTHMNRMISFSEDNRTITVQPGMTGPALEEMLNGAQEGLSAGCAFTCGHFPQSFEYSSVGGWISALGAGQASSLYGDAADLVVAQEYVTPAGAFETLQFPAAATGPKINDMMKGSEGCFGVLVSVTLKIFEYLPKNTRPFAFMFKDFWAAVEAGRKISQGRFGMPAVLRISDAEETDVAMGMYGLDRGLLDRFLTWKGYGAGRRCIVMGQAEGEKGFAGNVLFKVKEISRACGGFSLTGYPMKKWAHGRFSDPYLRDALNDYGILIDTLECSVTWEKLHGVHRSVRQVVKARPRTICMTHASHFYAQGTNLYFIFVTRAESIEEFRDYQHSVIDAIEQAGGSLSHHHGVGRMMAPWMARHLGEVQMGILRALKRHMDPNGIMNPGGLGL